jgi:hypothetical protein
MSNYTEGSGRSLTLEEKIMYLEAATRVHFVTYQWVDNGVLDYFQMLRRGENTKFLKDLHTVKELYEYSYTLRDKIWNKKL